jgi:hypothetical protein
MIVNGNGNGNAAVTINKPNPMFQIITIQVCIPHADTLYISIISFTPFVSAHLLFLLRR